MSIARRYIDLFFENKEKETRVCRIRKPASTESAPTPEIVFKERLRTFAVLSDVGKEKHIKRCAQKETGAQIAVAADECGFLFRLGARNARVC